MGATIFSFLSFFSLFFFLFFRNFYQTILEVKMPKSNSIYIQLGRWSYESTLGRQSSPRGRIKLTFIHRREIPDYHNSEVRGMGEYSIILYAEFAGRHADFISSLYHPHLDEARKENLGRGEGQRENCERRQRRKVSWKIPVSLPPPPGLETWNSTEMEKTVRQRGKRGAVVSACVFPEKEPVGRSSRERWPRKGKIREEARRRRVDNVGKT